MPQRYSLKVKGPRCAILNLEYMAFRGSFWNILIFLFLHRETVLIQIE